MIGKSDSSARRDEWKTELNEKIERLGICTTPQRDAITLYHSLSVIDLWYMLILLDLQWPFWTSGNLQQNCLPQSNKAPTNLYFLNPSFALSTNYLALSTNYLALSTNYLALSATSSAFPLTSPTPLSTFAL
jgi:hypothetical protein